MKPTKSTQKLIDLANCWMINNPNWENIYDLISQYLGEIHQYNGSVPAKFNSEKGGYEVCDGKEAEFLAFLK